MFVVGVPTAAREENRCSGWGLEFFLAMGAACATREGADVHPATPRPLVLGPRYPDRIGHTVSSTIMLLQAYTLVGVPRGRRPCSSCPSPPCLRDCGAEAFPAPRRRNARGSLVRKPGHGTTGGRADALSPWETAPTLASPREAWDRDLPVEGNEADTGELGGVHMSAFGALCHLVLAFAPDSRGRESRQCKVHRSGVEDVGPRRSRWRVLAGRRRRPLLSSAGLAASPPLPSVS